MSRTTLHTSLRRALQVALGNNLGARLYAAIVAAVNTQPGADWFRSAAKDDLTVSGEADGVFDWSAGSLFGRVAANEGRTISYVHAHVDKAHASGSMVLELYLNDGQTYGTGSSPGTMTRIATCTVPAGESDGASLGFTFTSDAAKVLPEGGYLHLQATSKPAGSGWRTFVDVHYAENST